MYSSRLTPHLGSSGRCSAEYKASPGHTVCWLIVSRRASAADVHVRYVAFSQPIPTPALEEPACYQDHTSFHINTPPPNQISYRLAGYLFEKHSVLMLAFSGWAGQRCCVCRCSHGADVYRLAAAKLRTPKGDGGEEVLLQAATA